MCIAMRPIKASARRCTRDTSTLSEAWRYKLWPASAHKAFGRGSNIWKTAETGTITRKGTNRFNGHILGRPRRALTTQSRDPHVKSEVQSHGTGNNVATITVSNPSKLNIVDSAIVNELIASCEELSRDRNLRAVVLQGGNTAPGKAPAFIGGADITEMYALQSSDEARAFITRIHLACEVLRDIPVPVIAKVNGFCLGAGLEILAACDLRIATEASVFGMPEVKVGIPSVVEAALLPGLIGMGRTRRLLYLAENIEAREAERWGMIEKVVRDEAQLDHAVKDWTKRIVEMGPKAIRNQKQLMQKWENLSVDKGIQAGVEAFADAFEDGGTEPRAMMGRFVNRKRD